jgi:hypothetical protein
MSRVNNRWVQVVKRPDFIDGETKAGIFHLQTASPYHLNDEHRYDNKVHCDDGTIVWVSSSYAGQEGERVTVKYSKDRQWWDVLETATTS